MKFFYIIVTTILLLGSQEILLPESSTFKDKIIQEGMSDSYIYQREDKSYFVYQKGEITYDHLKFISKAPLVGKNNMQALDKNNKIIEFYFEMHEEFEPDICGEGLEEYRISIEDKIDNFVITSTLIDSYRGDFGDAKGRLNKVKQIGIIEKKDIDSIYFNQEKSTINISNYFLASPYTMYYKFNEKYGFYGKLYVKEKADNLEFKLIKEEVNLLYDELRFVTGGIILQKDSLLGYHNITPIKYSKLAPFHGVLARVSLPDGREGYVTDKGVEYYDEN